MTFRLTNVILKQIIFVSQGITVQEYKAHTSTVPIIAAISILITAPVRAIFITLLSPRLLEKEDIMDYQSISMQCSFMQSSATRSCPRLSYQRDGQTPWIVRSPSSGMV